MSKKDYTAIARALKAIGLTGGDERTLIAVVMRLGDIFIDDNPLYDHERFVVACGLNRSLATWR